MTISMGIKKIRNMLAVVGVILTVIFGVFGLAHYNYNLARILPVSNTIKNRAFWYSLDANKLEKLLEEDKIDFYHFNSDGKNVVISSNEYSYSIYFNTKSSTGAPVFTVSSLTENGKGKVMIFGTDGDSAGVWEDSYENLDKFKIDEITNQGLTAYKKFIDDYNNI